MLPARWMVCAAVALWVAACATPEYQRASAECRNTALQAYPVVLEQQWVRRSREMMVPDGSTTCQSIQTESTGRRSTTTQTSSVCQPGLRRAIVQVDEPATVDVNAVSRERYVADCAASLCLQRFGNGRCTR